MLLTCVLYFACLFLLQLLAALLCNVLSVSTEDTGTQMMRGNVLGPKSTAVLIVVVFASTLSFFFLVGRYTTLYSQQTEGAVGMCARRSVRCCCLRKQVKALLVVRRQQEDRPPREFSQSNVVPAAAVLKMQSQVRSSILKRIANAKAKGRTSGTSRLNRGDTAAVVSLVVKNASEQAQLKIKQLEKRKRSSMSRLKSRLEKRKPRVKMTLLTTEPRVAVTATTSSVVDLNNSKLVVSAELKIKKTKAAALFETALKSKDKQEQAGK